jgi:hypothetical protein
MFVYEVQLVQPLRHGGSARAACTLGLVLLAVASVHGREQPSAHPTDEAEVFTGGEVTTPGRAVKPPAIAYWKIAASLQVAPGERPMRVGLLLPLSDGRQDVVTRRARAPGFRLREVVDAGNVRAEWTGVAPSGATIA